MLYEKFSKRISDCGFPKVKKDYTERSYIVSKNIEKIFNSHVFLVCYLFNVIEFGFSYDFISDH